MSLDMSQHPSGPARDEWEERLGAYLDGELDAPARADVERHLQSCARCRAGYERLRTLGDALRRELPVHPAPDVLRARIRSTLEAAAPATGTSGVTASPRALRRWRWAALAASVLFVASATYDVVTRHGNRDAAPDAESADALVEHDLLSSHVRALMPGHLTDVASTNRHNVKPWFNGRLDYSPPVYGFSADSFPLVGGRVDYVGGRTVAVLVYQRRQHVISLYVWPADRERVSASRRPVVVTRQGYHMLAWTRDGMTRWAVSDLNADELREFAGLEQRADSLAQVRAPGTS